MTKPIQEVLENIIKRFPSGKHVSQIKKMLEGEEPFAQEAVDALLKQIEEHRGSDKKYTELTDKQDALMFMLQLSEAVWK